MHLAVLEAADDVIEVSLRRQLDREAPQTR
jgi:hypothetical protein